MTDARFRARRHAFSLVEVVLSIGIVGFSMLTTVGLLSVANETNKRARDEAFAAQLTANEFERMRSLSAVNPPTAQLLYFDANLAEVSAADKNKATYELQITFVTPAPLGTADRVVNAEVRYPADAPNQTKVRYTTLMNIPKP